MATEITSLSVRIGAELSSFRRGKAEVQRGVKEMEDSFGRLQRSVSSMERTFLTLRGAIATLGLGALATSAITTAARMDALEMSLQAVAGGSRAAQVQLSRLVQVAKAPGLGFAEAVQGSVNLQAVGFSAQFAERALKAFGNAIATTGGGRAELDRVLFQLTQMAAAGKIVAQDLRPIVQTAPAVARALQNLFGTTSAEAIQAQMGSVDEFLNLLITELEKLPPVAGGARKALEDLGDVTFRLRAAFGQRLFAMFESQVRKATDAAEELADSQVAIARTFGLVRDGAIALGAIGLGRMLSPAITALWQLNTAGRAAAAGMGVLRGAFALLGGWPGVIIAGLSGLWFWLNRTKRAAEETAAAVEQAISTRVAQLSTLDEEGTLQAINRSAARVGELQRRLSELQAELATSPLQFQGGLLGAPTAESVQRRQDLQRQIEETSRALKEERGVVEALAQQYAQLAGARLAADRARDKTAQQEEQDRAKAIADVHKQLADALRNVVAMETLLGDSFDGNAARAKLYHAAIEELIKLGVEPADEAVQRYAASLRTLEEATRAAEAATRAAEAAERERARLESAALGIVQQSLTAQQRYEQAVQTLRAALDQAIITQEQYNQAVAHLDKELAKATRSLRDTLAEQGVAAGEALIRGLLTGARNMKDILKSTLINLAVSYIMGPVKLALGIASPSKVFRSYGEAIGDGLALGIESRIGRVQTAVSRLSGATAMPALSPVTVGAADAVGVASRARQTPVSVHVPAPPAASDPFSVARDATWHRILSDTLRQLEAAGAIQTIIATT